LGGLGVAALGRFAIGRGFYLFFIPHPTFVWSRSRERRGGGSWVVCAMGPGALCDLAGFLFMFEVGSTFSRVCGREA
jgi:hypothetical protein